MKTCKTCGTAKPADAQHFPEYLTRHGNVSLRGTCLDCTRKAARERMARVDVNDRRAARRKHRASEMGREQHARFERERRARAAGFAGHAEMIEAAQRLKTAKALCSALKALRRKKEIQQRSTAPWLEPGIDSAEKYRRQYRLDPEFNLKERIRRQIRKAAKRDGVAELIRQAMLRNGSSSTVEHMLGYSIAQLRTHLERQFLDGMGWHNYGQWHIDHITPQSAFDMTDEAQWRACWCLSNLRPLWARDNLAKAAQQHTLL
jgi:hypothetical protein